MPKRSTRPLDEYRKKRDPARTNEPFGPEPTRSGGTRNGDFVVHLHDARRRHHDLRIEIGGALQSFAVPKGPSIAPLDKRLAVETEPHPIEYLDFEDVIPEGNYGAGAMIVWDRGRIRYLETTAEEGLRAGKIDFELSGFKLRGRFALVRTKPRGGERPADGEKNQWLLIKKADAFADTTVDVVERFPRSVLSGLTVEELPRREEVGPALEARATVLGATEGDVRARHVTPMLCAVDGPGLEAPGWFYELKLDGVRILADKRGDEVSLFYRTHRPATAAYPEVTRAVRALAPERILLDGEVLAFDEQGRPDFQRLARRIHASRPHDVLFASRAVPVVYVVFDVLALGARDLRGLPLSARKALLMEAVRGRGYLRALDHLEDDGRPLWDLCEAQGLEGIVAKRADSVYEPGPHRSGAWVKKKRERDDDFVVVGHTRGTGGRARLGALDLASYEGEHLVVRGKVGSGLAETGIDTLLEALAPLAVHEPAAEGDFGSAPDGRTFVAPEIVVRVRYVGWSDEGKLRFPVFMGIRPDVVPSDCTAAPRGETAAMRATPPPSTARDTRRHRVVLTNQDKVFWPDEGYTKGDLCAYYETIAPAMLPYLAGRPVVLVRYPDGIAGKSFFQWNLPKGTPPWVRSLPLAHEEKNKVVHTFLVEDVDTLLLIANLGAIPIHVIAARAEHLDACDFFTIDFDLGERLLRDGVTLALSLRSLLEDAGLEGYPKTSGQTGLHVLVPLGPDVGFDTARLLADLFGRLLIQRHPDLATMERLKKKRGGRILVDTGQTGRTRTIVAPWSVRAHPGATVSMPLAWDEVGFALDPRRFDIVTGPARFAEQGDPMRPMLEARPDVAAAVERLGALLA